MLNVNPPQPFSTQPNPAAYRQRINTAQERSLGPLTSRRSDNPRPLKPSLLPFTEIRVLLAEDSRVNQKVALARLQKLGYRADAVVNGFQVLEALKNSPYDLIFMDCQMPEMDGYEATRAIRQWEQSSGPPCPWNAPVYIIALTAHAMEGDRDRCLAAGMNDYLSKPVLVPQFQGALERWQRAFPVSCGIR